MYCEALKLASGFSCVGIYMKRNMQHKITYNNYDIYIVELSTREIACLYMKNYFNDDQISKKMLDL